MKCRRNSLETYSSVKSPMYVEGLARFSLLSSFGTPHFHNALKRPWYCCLVQAHHVHRKPNASRRTSKQCMQMLELTEHTTRLLVNLGYAIMTVIRFLFHAIFPTVRCRQAPTMSIQSCRRLISPTSIPKATRTHRPSPSLLFRPRP